MKGIPIPGFQGPSPSRLQICTMPANSSKKTGTLREFFKILYFLSLLADLHLSSVFDAHCEPCVCVCVIVMCMLSSSHVGGRSSGSVWCYQHWPSHTGYRTHRYRHTGCHNSPIITSAVLFMLFGVFFTAMLLCVVYCKKEIIVVLQYTKFGLLRFDYLSISPLAAAQLWWLYFTTI